MQARYQCPACGVQLTLTTSPESRFECPKCKRFVALAPIETAPPSPKPARVAKPAPAPKPTTPITPRKPERPRKPVSRKVAAADEFEPPWQSPPAPPPSPASSTPDENHPLLATAWDNPRARIWAIATGVVVLLSVLLIAVFVLQKPAIDPQQAQAKSQQMEVEQPANPVVITPTKTQPSPPSPPSIAERSPIPASLPTRPDPAPPPSTTPDKKPESPKVLVSSPKAPRAFDQFGNQVGNDVGLGQQDEFKGQRILFWGGHTALGKVFFAPSNPLWKSLEEMGFSVRREFGAFKTEWLSNTDQLWILSTSTIELSPMPVTPEQLEDILKQELARNPLSKRPFGWSDRNFLLAERADYEVSLSPRFPLDDTATAAIEKFIMTGKGVCLLAANEPYVNEANELANHLYGVNVSGNYSGQRIAYIRQRELSADVVHKFKSAYEIDEHPLLTGVNFIYEGMAVSNVGASDKLEVVMRASDGQPLLAVSKVPGQRVVIDCGFTRYGHGANDETSFILKTAGTVRLAQNIAAYLAGKDRREKR